MFDQEQGLKFGEEHWPVVRQVTLSVEQRPHGQNSEFKRRRLEHEREINRPNMFGQE